MHLQDLATAQEAANEIILRDAILVAVAVVRKLHPEWARVYGLTEIEAVIRECLGHLDREMRVTIRSHPDELDAVKERIGKAVEAVGFEGKILCQPDPRIAAGDCRVEWGDGGAERNQSHVWTEVDRIVTAALSSFGAIVEQTMQ
jgi:flagellar assembly protein FliH